jgi:hypothetical protein
MAVTRERIILDAENLRALVAGEAIVCSARHGSQVEISISRNVGWRSIISALVEAVDAERRRMTAQATDPPEAREFLPARHRRR